MTIVSLVVLLLLYMPSTILVAAPWVFDRAIDVSTAGTGDNHYFHHLDSSGRHNIAVTDRGVAIAWEDDRDGRPRVYLGYKHVTDNGFTHEIQISGNGDAYEPSLVALSVGHFAIAWEEDGRIHARMATVDGRLILGPIARIDNNPSTQVSLTAHDDRVYAVWSQRSGRYGRIHAMRLRPNDKREMELGVGCPVDIVPPTDEQLYPSAVVSDGRLLVAWEDRRPKHTIIMAAVEQRNHPCRFSNPQRISEQPDSRGLPYGSGHGVTRVALGHFGEHSVFAVWEDKRDFRDGYDIWGAPFLNDGNSFGSNEKVQDDFGGLAKQRHATITGHQDGVLVIAWDDEREGNTDVVVSWYQDGEWSEDWPLPIASGEGRQNSPSIVLDARGDLHITWVERQDIGGTTRLKYAIGRRLKTE